MTRRGRARAGALLGLALLALASAAVHDGATALDAWILRHARDPADDPPVRTTGLPATAAAHRDALRADPRHGQRWVVAAAHGPLDAAPTVVLIPQFHRSPVDPIVWSSLGQAIADIQDNIDTLLWRLVAQHGLRCVGSEGSWSRQIERTPELDLVAGWGLELAARGDEVARELGVEDGRIAPAVHTVDAALGPYLARCLRMLDGAGVMQARVRQLRPALAPPLERFGVEDRALNERAVELAGQIHEVALRLARLQPASQGVALDAIGAMWLAEYPAFASDTAQHLQRALDDLTAARLALLAADADAEAQQLGRYAGLAQEVTARVLQLEAVAARHAHELEVAHVEAQAASLPADRRLGAAERRELARLEREAARLDALYAEVTARRRERHAVATTLARLQRAPNQICALVMGASHAPALVDELRRASRGRVAVLEVQPFPPDDEVAADGDGERADAGPPVPDAGLRRGSPRAPRLPGRGPRGTLPSTERAP